MHMPVQFQTAFSSQKPSVMASSATLGGRRINLFTLLSLALFFAAAAASLSVFFYRGFLARQIAAMDSELVAARKSFEPEFIDTAVRLSKRIEAGKRLLAGHRALSPLFEALEKKTLETVRFQNFSFDASNAVPTLSMTGEGKSFNAVALQSDVFGNEKRFMNPVFSNFSLSESGDILFNFKTELAPTLLNFAENLNTSLPNTSTQTTP